MNLLELLFRRKATFLLATAQRIQSAPRNALMFLDALYLSLGSEQGPFMVVLGTHFTFLLVVV